MKTVIRRTGGRLGNTMFNIISGAYYAKMIGANYIVKYNRSYNNDLLQYVNNIYKNIVFSFDENIESSYNDIDIIKETNEMKYTAIVSDKDTIVVDGCRQSPMYWNNDKDFALKLFDTGFDDMIINIIKSVYSDVDFSNCVAMNVRRGDYTGGYVKSVIGLLSAEWYLNAMNHFDDNKSVFVISDDINWCKNVFKSDRFIFADRNFGDLQFPRTLIDLYMQRLTGDNIIANSTFSWWGAYLNTTKNRRVVCPFEWGHFAGQSTDYIPTNDNWETEKSIWE